MENIATLQDFLTYMFGGGGAGLLTFWIMSKIKWPDATSEWKRYISMVMTALLACAFWGISAALGYAKIPGDWVGWCETLFAIGFAALVTTFAVHGRIDLRKRDFLAKNGS